MCYTDKDVNCLILYRDSGMEFNMYTQESQLMQLLEKYSDKTIVILHSREEGDRFLNSLL